MLILTRREGEGIRLGEHIRIVLVQLKGNQVRIGIECPSHIRVLREELYQGVREENVLAMSAEPAQAQDFGKHLSLRTTKPPTRPKPRQSS